MSNEEILNTDYSLKNLSLKLKHKLINPKIKTGDLFFDPVNFFTMLKNLKLRIVYGVVGMKTNYIAKTKNYKDAQM